MCIANVSRRDSYPENALDTLIILSIFFLTFFIILNFIRFDFIIIKNLINILNFLFILILAKIIQVLIIFF